MQTGPSRFVHVLAIDRHDELAVNVLAELQLSGYRTLCERVTSLTDAAGALERRNWDVVVCNAGGVDFELDEAGAICSALKYASQEMPVATAESARKTRVCVEAVFSAPNSPRAATRPHTSGRMKLVRSAVARFEGTDPTPILARMAVAAAATADTRA